MNIRKVTSLTAFLSFLVTLLTSIILYLVPYGRVAYWAEWRLWALSKDQWEAIHINVGFLFLLSLLLHIYYNWKLIVSYLKNTAKQLKIFTKEFNIALILTVICVIGTYIEIPPFSTIININEDIKNAASKKYGEPPYGHAELSSLKTFAKRMGIDLKAAIRSLQESGYQVDKETETLKEIAERSKVTPQVIYLAMSPATPKAPIIAGQSQSMPEMPAPGTGNLTLADLCSQYNLNLKIVVRSLKEAGIESKANMTIREIGEINKKSPVDIYEQIKSIADSKIEK